MKKVLDKKEIISERQRVEKIIQNSKKNVVLNFDSKYSIDAFEGNSYHSFKKELLEKRDEIRKIIKKRMFQPAS